MNRVKLIALDLDGTLLCSDHSTVPQENILAIREAVARGVRVVISTGRMLEDASDFARRWALPCMIISSNGSRASDGPLPGGRIIFKKNLEPQDAKRTLDLLLACGLIVNAFEDGCVTTENHGSGWVYHAAQRGLIRATYGREALYAAADRGVLKIFAVTGGFSGEGDSERALRAGEILRRQMPRLVVTSSGPGNVEVMPPDSGKGSALAAMAECFGLNREEVMAVGDADNDMSMLAYAWHSVAMGNASAVVKAACRYQTSTNDEAGVARIIWRVLNAE